MPPAQPSIDPSAADFRARAIACLERNDWHGADRWAKGWIGSGGATHLDPWLVYVAAALISGKPRNAVHSIDLAAGLWLPGPQDRAALLWLRGCIVHRRLGDPKTALVDLTAAVPALPTWLSGQRDDEIAECQAAAATSRKRTASVKRAPAYRKPPETVLIREYAYEPRADGAPPDRRLLTILARLGLSLG